MTAENSQPLGPDAENRAFTDDQHQVYFKNSSFPPFHGFPTFSTSGFDLDPLGLEFDNFDLEKWGPASGEEPQNWGDYPNVQ